MRKEAAGIILILFMLSMFGSILPLNPNGLTPVTATSTANSHRGPSDDNVTSYPILNPDFSSYVYSDPRYWLPTKGGTDPSYIYDTWYSTSGYKNSPCVGLYMNQPYNQPSRRAFEYWYQDWIYNGTIPPTSANVTFRWKYSTSTYYRLTGSNNTLSILIQYPAGSGPAKLLLRRMVNGSSSYVANQWYSETIDIKNYLTNSSNTFKYRIMLRFDCMTYPYAPNSGYFYTYWDDVYMTIRYAPQLPPRDLQLSIVGTSTEKNFTNSRSVVLGVSGKALSLLGFSNDNVTWQLFAPATNVNWTLSLGDGVKTVWFNASNSLGLAGPVNSTIFCDTVAPPVPQMIEFPANESLVSDRKPTFKWTCEDFQPGSNITHYEIWISRSSNFEPTAEGKNITDYTYTTYTSEELGDGLWYWRVRAVDRAGNNGTWIMGSFNVQVMSPIMVYLAVGGVTGGAMFLLFIAYYFAKRARIPFVIKKIDQSIKLISRGEVTSPIPVRSRAQALETIYQAKLSILSRERLEELGKGKIEFEGVAAQDAKAGTVGVKQVEAEPAGVSEPAESEVDAIAKELESLGAKEELEPVEETDLIRKEIEELEKAGKRKKKS